MPSTLDETYERIQREDANKPLEYSMGAEIRDSTLGFSSASSDLERSELLSAGQQSSYARESKTATTQLTVPDDPTGATNDDPKACPNAYDDLDAMSIRTDGRDYELPEPYQTTLIDEFAGQLCGDLETITHIKDWIRCADAARQMSDLLRDFTLLLTANATDDKAYEDAATFIRHKRPLIIKTFTASLDAWRPNTDNGMSLEQKMDMWRPSNDGSQLLDAGTSDPEPLDAQAREEQQDLDDVKVGWPTDAPMPRDVPRAKRFLLKRTEYPWLIRQLRTSSGLLQTGETFKIVRNMLATCLSQAPKSGVSVALEWDLLTFLDEQYPASRSDISNVLVYCGLVEKSYACTTVEYVALLWPDAGGPVLQCLQMAIESHGKFARVELPDLEIHFHLKGDKTHFTVSGNRGHVLEAAEVTVFLSTACRANALHNTAVGYRSLVQSDAEPDQISRFELEWQMEPVAEDVQGGCWQAMVRNPVIAKGYPVPLRQEQRGLELSRDLMLTLSQADWATTVKNVPILKGHRSALIPTALDCTSIVWHFLVSRDNSRMTYRQIADALGDECDDSDLNLEALQFMRHICHCVAIVVRPERSRGSGSCFACLARKQKTWSRSPRRFAGETHDDYA